MIRKIIGKNNNAPTKHLTHNNLKITDEKDIANHLTEKFLQNSSAKNQSKSFQIIKTKAEKCKIKFQSKNTESYSQPCSIAKLKESLNKAHNTAVGHDKIHYRFLNRITWTIHKFPHSNLLRFMEQRWHTKNMERNHSYTDTQAFQRQYKCKKLQTHFSS